MGNNFATFDDMPVRELMVRVIEQWFPGDDAPYDKVDELLDPVRAAGFEVGFPTSNVERYDEALTELDRLGHQVQGIGRQFLSNACIHQAHEQCEEECSYCNDGCACPCHPWHTQDDKKPSATVTVRGVLYRESTLEDPDKFIEHGVIFVPVDPSALPPDPVAEALRKSAERRPPVEWDDETRLRLATRVQALLEAKEAACCADEIYWCPRAARMKCPVHGGLDACCDQSERHTPLAQFEVQAKALLKWWMEDRFPDIASIVADPPAMTADETYEFYADPANQEPQGPPVRRKKAGPTPPPDDPRRTCRRCGNAPMPDSWVCAFHGGDDSELPDGTMTSASYSRWKRYWEDPPPPPLSPLPPPPTNPEVGDGEWTGL